MPTTSHFPITQASLISAFTFIVGQVCAFVPTLGPDKQNLISAGSTTIAAVFLIANAIHALSSRKTVPFNPDAPATQAVPGTAGRVS